jgi:predicted DsbA family dithiol-disulfide isomerase
MAAFVSDQVTGDMVEASEFPELSDRFGVYGVPKTIINAIGEVEGAVPEQQFMDQIMQVLK